MAPVPPVLVDAVNGTYDGNCNHQRRLVTRAFNLEDPLERAAFVKRHQQAVAIGTCAFALSKL